jgi:hypothetical protein
MSENEIPDNIEKLFQRIEAGDLEGVSVFDALKALHDAGECISPDRTEKILHGIEPCCRGVEDMCLLANFRDSQCDEEELDRILCQAEEGATTSAEYIAVADVIADATLIYGDLWDQKIKTLMSKAVQAIETESDWRICAKFCRSMCSARGAVCS